MMELSVIFVIFKQKTAYEMRISDWSSDVCSSDLLVEEDLIPALDSGRLGGATLDVLRVEPAAPDHPFWSHPKILLTPHIASLIDPETGARLIAGNRSEERRVGKECVSQF